MNNKNGFDSNNVNNEQNDTFYNDFENHNNNNNNTMDNSNNNGYSNSHYEYQEKQYNSGFLDSHTEVSNGSKISRFLLLGFYLLFAIVIVVVLVFLLKGNNKNTMSFKNNNIKINVGDTEVLEVVNDKGENIDDELTWSSDNEEIVTVDSNGIVEGVSVGKTAVTVKNSKGHKAVCSVTVEDDSSNPIDEPTPTAKPNNDPTSNPNNTSTPKPTNKPKSTATPKATSNKCCCLYKELKGCSWRNNVKQCPNEQPYEDSSSKNCSGSSVTNTPKPSSNDPAIPASSINTKYINIPVNKIELSKGETKTFTIKVYNAVAVYDLKVTKAKDDAKHISVSPTTTDFLDGLSASNQPQWAEATIKVTGNSSGYNYIVISPNSAGVVSYDTTQYLTGTHTILVHVK